MAKKFDPKAKAKRDKIIAGVAGVIFLGVLAFSVPKTLKMMNPGNVETTSATPTTTAATGAPSLAPPSLDGTAPAAPAGGSGLSDPDTAQMASFSQLVAFDRFSSKDPFKQQVSESGAAPESSGATTPASTKHTGSGVVPPVSTTPAPEGTPVSPPPPPLPLPTAASVSVNGAPAETVTVAQDFPLPPAESLFHVVAIGRSWVKIAIVGGSYADGAPAVKLKRGKPLTLVNTADGTRYLLKLVWLGVGAPPGAATTTPVPASPPAAVTTTTTTTTTASG
jgi:hypothetical protein